MRIFPGIFNSRDKSTNRTAGASYSFFMGGSSAGKNVNERSAMQMTAVYSCVRILSEAVAGLPLHMYKYTSDGGKEKAVEHPLYRLLHDEPNPEMSSFVFRETLMTHLLCQDPHGGRYTYSTGKGKLGACRYREYPYKRKVQRCSPPSKEVYGRLPSAQDEGKQRRSSAVLHRAFPRCYHPTGGLGTGAA